MDNEQKVIGIFIIITISLTTATMYLSAVTIYNMPPDTVRNSTDTFEKIHTDSKHDSLLHSLAVITDIVACIAIYHCLCGNRRTCCDHCVTVKKIDKRLKKSVKKREVDNVD